MRMGTVSRRPSWAPASDDKGGGKISQATEGQVERSEPIRYKVSYHHRDPSQAK